MHIKGALQRAPHRDAVLLAPFRDDAVVLNVEMLLRAGAVFAFHDVRGVGPCGVHVALFKQEAFEQVVRAPDDRIPALALLDGEDGRQWLILDAHRVHGLAQLVFVWMRQQQNRLVAVVHFPIGEARLIGGDELNEILAWDIVGGDDGELCPVDAAVISDGANEPARDGTADSGAVPHALPFDVIHIPRAAQQLVQPFLAGD